VTEYTVLESEGLLSVSVRVISGLIMEPVMISLSTMDGTATGTYMKYEFTLSDQLFKKI
jgi:hypothetical protein